MSHGPSSNIECRFAVLRLPPSYVYGFSKSPVHSRDKTKTRDSNFVAGTNENFQARILRESGYSVTLLAKQRRNFLLIDFPRC